MPEGYSLLHEWMPLSPVADISLALVDVHDLPEVNESGRYQFDRLGERNLGSLCCTEKLLVLDGLEQQKYC